MTTTAYLENLRKQRELYQKQFEDLDDYDDQEEINSQDSPLPIENLDNLPMDLPEEFILDGQLISKSKIDNPSPQPNPIVDDSEPTMEKYFIVFSADDVIAYDCEKFNERRIKEERQKTYPGKDYTICLVNSERKTLELMSKRGDHIKLKSLKFDLTNPNNIILFLKNVYETDRKSLGGNYLYFIDDESENDKYNEDKTYVTDTYITPQKNKINKSIDTNQTNNSIHDTIYSKIFKDLKQSIDNMNTRITNLEQNILDIDNHPTIISLSNIMKRLSLLEILNSGKK